MTQHAELIRRLETNAALMPSDAAVALEYKAAAEALKEQAAEIERLRKDAALVAARERERIAKVFDRRAHPVWGFYEPEEPAKIIRALNTEGEGNDKQPASD